jgi:prepilin-type processing-associated H-X9-DG protein
VSAFICPSRRSAEAYPMNNGSIPNFYNTPSAPPVKLGRTDYAGNAGGGQSHGGQGPRNFSEGDNTPLNRWSDFISENGMLGNTTGVILRLGKCTMADISDGTSCTYLAGEKYLDPDGYTTGTDGDDQGWATGYDTTVLRFTNLLEYTAGSPHSFADLNDETAISSECAPMQDQPGQPLHWCFGSAHSGAFNMAFCDGSVSSISYSIAPAVHLRLGSRNDGRPIDGKAY